MVTCHIKYWRTERTVPASLRHGSITARPTNYTWPANSTNSRPLLGSSFLQPVSIATYPLTAQHSPVRPYAIIRSPLPGVMATCWPTVSQFPILSEGWHSSESQVLFRGAHTLTNISEDVTIMSNWSIIHVQSPIRFRPHLTETEFLGSWQSFIQSRNSSPRNGFQDESTVRLRLM